MRFPEFNPTAEITNILLITKILGSYNLIIGRDLLHKLGVDINFSTKTMCWNGVPIDMKPPTCTCKDSFHVEEELFFSDKRDRIAEILDAKYKPANLKELQDNLLQINNNQKNNYTHCLTKNVAFLIVH